MMTATKLVGSTILERIGNTPLVRLDELTRDLPGIQILGRPSGRIPAVRSKIGLPPPS